MAALLEARDYVADTAENGVAALATLEAEPWDVVVTDLRMPAMGGTELLAEIRNRYPDIDVIVVTGHGTVESAVKAMRLGACDYLTKPFSVDALVERLIKLAPRRARQQELAMLRMESHRRTSRGGVVGECAPMRVVTEQIRLFSSHEAPILITGETGTGKEVVAHAIHEHGPRRRHPFVAVGCGTIPRDLAESELFGHERGAFTGAHAVKRGLFEQATGGTLLLDDIDDMPLDLQVKLLRVLEQGRCMRVGATTEIAVDVRVIATTKVELQTLVDAGAFRADLFYRLRGLEIRLPALRERGADILLLAQHFLERGARASARDVPFLSPEAADRLVRYPWPGNVRELSHTIEAALVMCRSDTLDLSHLPVHLRSDQVRSAGLFTLHLNGAKTIPFKDTVRDFEQRLVDWAMRKSAGEQAAAADLLDLPRTTFQSKVSRLKSDGGSTS